MATAPSKLSSARRHLDALAESWQADHAAAMNCWDYEESLAEAVMVFHFMDESVRVRRKCVFHGLQEPDPKLDEEERELYAQWLALIEDDRPRLEALEKRYGRVEGVDRLRACLDGARAFLAKWAPAVPAMAPASRVVEFNREDRELIQTLLRSPAGSPGRPTRPPRSVPVGDPSRLK
jgi:hypothetical protein